MALRSAHFVTQHVNNVAVQQLIALNAKMTSMLNQMDHV